ncbi:hypothetical protein P7K49_030596 [Saguinus oedipus]|uniref:Uncharacterized protein n=1 Tax=Saguinus oedipus TaxID=9490 RepID=A0ABQ9U4N3_SAGOE|nr:hypothetical protein P7K49_030596 [Saguinus oedipus]
MATALETEASPPTDSSWESGGRGDDEMKQALPELESSPQNGGGGGLSIAETGGGAGPEETAGAEAAQSLSHEQPQESSEAGTAALPRGPEEPERPRRPPLPSLPRLPSCRVWCKRKRRNHAFLLPLPVEVGSSSGLKLVRKAALPERKDGSRRPSLPIPEGREAVVS